MENIKEIIAQYQDEWEKTHKVLNLKNENKIQSMSVFILRKLNYTVFAVPNSNKRGAREIAVHKATGLMAGAPDLVVLLKNGICLLLELKTAKGGQRDRQKDFERLCAILRHKYRVCRSVEEVLECVLGEK